MATLIELLKKKGRTLDGILNAIMRSKEKVHKEEYHAVIVGIYQDWKQSTNPHERKVLRGAYKKFCDTYFYTFGEPYHNSLHGEIRHGR